MWQARIRAFCCRPLVRASTATSTGLGQTSKARTTRLVVIGEKNMDRAAIEASLQG